MAFFKWLLSRRIGSQDSAGIGGNNSPNAPVRQRNIKNLSASESEQPVVESKASKAKKVSKAAKKLVDAKNLKTKKKSTPPTKTVKESISVVLRRQIPVRFDEEARSWLGGLPRMPIEIEWPRASSNEPLHFVAQLECASLPPELWGGLGPREGWLLLFADFEAFTDQIERPFVRVVHVTELGPEAEPPKGLYFARRDVSDLSGLPKTVPDAQRQHFRKWPVDLVPVAADRSELTGSELYGAPEEDHHISSFAIDRPMTWRGAYTILAGLVQGHNLAAGYEQNWVGNSGGLLDYPEPDADGYNKEWQERRQRLADQIEGGYRTPEFREADRQLKTQMYEERRKGWTQRAFKVLEEQTAISIEHLNDHRAKLAAAVANGDDNNENASRQSIDYFEKQVADRQTHKVYLEELFAKYTSEEAFLDEINRAGRAHLEWVQQTQDQLREILDKSGRNDLDALIPPNDWDDIIAQIANMKSVYWCKTYDTDVLRKVERGVHFSITNAVREEVLDQYVSPPSSITNELDSDIVSTLEPRLRNLECDRPHKLGGVVDSVYEDPLKKDNVLLFQLASDAAMGWICGDLGLIYVSIHASDLEAGSFENVKAWLEA